MAPAAGSIDSKSANAVGNVLANEIDTDFLLGLEETLIVIGARVGSEATGAAYAAVSGTTVIDGTYGNLTINPDGSFSYALDRGRAVSDQSINDVFSYQITDAHGLIDMADLTFFAISQVNEPIGGDHANIIRGHFDGEVLASANHLIGPDPAAPAISWAVSVPPNDPHDFGKTNAALQLDGIFDHAHLHIASDGGGNTFITFSEIVI